MTSGSYLLSGHDGPYAVERFTCGDDGGAWHWTATREHPRTGVPLGRLVVEVRAGGQRVHAEAGGWLLRGGTVGASCTWRRGEQERTAVAQGFTGTSPGWAAATVRLLAPTAPVRARLVRLADEVLATRLVDEAWAPRGRQDLDGLPVDTWEVEDLSTGEHRAVHLHGDVVLTAPGARLLDLTQL